MNPAREVAMTPAIQWVISYQATTAKNNPKGHPYAEGHLNQLPSGPQHSQSKRHCIEQHHKARVGSHQLTSIQYLQSRSKPTKHKNGVTTTSAHQHNMQSIPTEGNSSNEAHSHAVSTGWMTRSKSWCLIPSAEVSK
jgi:hypothetical protein